MKLQMPIMNSNPIKMSLFKLLIIKSKKVKNQVVSVGGIGKPLADRMVYSIGG
jgi:hypothetical protein